MSPWGNSRTLIARLALTCALLSSAFALSTKAAADQWGEQFKTPFVSQIADVVQVVGGDLAPGASARLRTIAGLNVGDVIFVDGNDNQAHAALVTSINQSTGWITWTPSLPGNIVPAMNQWVR